MARQIRSLSVYKKILERLPEFRLISSPLDARALAKLGFDGGAQEGDSIMPTVSGRATLFNARGKEVIRRDLPMETFSRMIFTSWKDWHGQTHHGLQTRDYEAYPREQIPPPEEYLTLVQREQSLFAVSRVLRTDDDESSIVNIVNVYLELFDDFKIVQPDLGAPVQVRKLSWKVLPLGAYPFERARHELEEYFQRLDDGERELATERIRTITRHQPDFVAVGIGGFSDYVVFGFTERRRFVLESPHTGNATYVFRQDWENLSHFSKREILQANLQEARLIHNSRWPTAVSEIIRKK